MKPYWKGNTLPVSLEVPAGLEQLPEIADFIQENAREAALPSRRTWEILLAVDELCSRMLQCCASPDETLFLSWEQSGSLITLSVAVSGLPYNPLSENLTDGNAEEEQQLGGMGLSLVRKMVDELSYQRKGRLNILVVKKTLRKKKAGPHQEKQ
jgi:serine/threonine-protein kinase RsbW